MSKFVTFEIFKWINQEIISIVIIGNGNMMELGELESVNNLEENPFYFFHFCGKSCSPLFAKTLNIEIALQKEACETWQSNAFPGWCLADRQRWWVLFWKVSALFWNPKFSKLKVSAERLCFSANSVRNSVDFFEGFKKLILWLVFHFSELFNSTSISRHNILIFSINYEKSEQHKFSSSIFLLAKDITKTRIESAQATKLIWFSFSKEFSRLVGWTFEIISKNMSFYGYSKEYWGKFTYFEYEECHFKDHFKRFHHFWLRFHNYIFPSACFNIRANSE